VKTGGVGTTVAQRLGGGATESAPGDAPASAHQAGRPRSPAVDQALIRATLAILEEEGYARLSMAGVAKRAGVSGTTLYRRWSSKEELVGASLVSLRRTSECPDTGTLAGDLAEVLRHSVESLGGEPGKVLRGLVGEIFKSPELAALARNRLGDPGGEIIGTILARATARGEVPPLDPALARNLIAGPVFHQFLMDRAPLTAAMVDDLVPMIVAALQAAPRRDGVRRSNRAGGGRSAGR
jgi:AcrR family transcriptional regulator